MTEMLKMDGLKAIGDKLRKVHLLGRFAKPSEIAAAALFLASDDASFVTGQFAGRGWRLYGGTPHHIGLSGCSIAREDGTLEARVLFDPNAAEGKELDHWAKLDGKIALVTGAGIGNRPGHLRALRRGGCRGCSGRTPEGTSR